MGHDLTSLQHGPGRVYEIVCFSQRWLVKPAPTRTKYSHIVTAWAGAGLRDSLFFTQMAGQTRPYKNENYTITNFLASGFNRRVYLLSIKEIIPAENHLAALTILARSGECRTTKQHCDIPKHMTHAASPKTLVPSGQQV